MSEFEQALRKSEAADAARLDAAAVRAVDNKASIEAFLRAMRQLGNPLASRVGVRGRETLVGWEIPHGTRSSWYPDYPIEAYFGEANRWNDGTVVTTTGAVLQTYHNLGRRWADNDAGYEWNSWADIDSLTVAQYDACLAEAESLGKSELATALAIVFRRASTK